MPQPFTDNTEETKELVAGCPYLYGVTWRCHKNNVVKSVPATMSNQHDHPRKRDRTSRRIYTTYYTYHPVGKKRELIMKEKLVKVLVNSVQYRRLVRKLGTRPFWY